MNSALITQQNKAPNKKIFLVAEMLVLFLLVPIVIAVNPKIWLNFVVALSAIFYIVWVAKKEWGHANKASIMALIGKSLQPNKLHSKHLIRIAIMWSIFAAACALYLAQTQPENLFYVFIKQPGLWLIIVFVYGILSVLPQEFIYRVFFFKRYGSFNLPFPITIMLNALFFSLAHLMFNNNLVLVLTFAGGLLFSYTYIKTQSYWLVCMEHALYGLWLFTVGMGSMLAFPGMAA